MRRPRMTVRKCMVIVALAVLILAIQAEWRRRDRRLLEIMAGFAILEARRDLGDLSRFDMTARWIGDDAQVDFVPRMPGREGRRCMVDSFLGEIVSTRPLSKP